MPNSINYRGTVMTELVGQPALAIVNANYMMARQQVSLLLQNCFYPVDESGDQETGERRYAPVMISMLLKKSSVERNEDNDATEVRQSEIVFQVPLITLVPLNYLAIDDMDISFEVDIHSTAPPPEDKNDNLLTSSSSDDALALSSAPQLVGSIRHDDGDKKSAGSPLSVSISTRNIPVPKGVASILDVYTKCIQAVQEPAE